MDKKCKEITLKYYSKWLGAEAVFEENRGKIVPVYSEERNRIQPGYGQPFSLYVFCGENKIIISYGDVYKKEIPHLVKKISDEMPVEQPLKNTGKEGMLPKRAAVAYRKF